MKSANLVNVKFSSSLTAKFGMLSHFYSLFQTILKRIDALQLALDEAVMQDSSKEWQECHMEKVTLCKKVIQLVKKLFLNWRAHFCLPLNQLKSILKAKKMKVFKCLHFQFHRSQLTAPPAFSFVAKRAEIHQMKEFL